MLDLAKCRAIHEAMTPGEWQQMGKTVQAVRPDGQGYDFVAECNSQKTLTGIAHEHNTYGELLTMAERATAADKRCRFCGEPCDSLAADPGQWPLTFCLPGDEGKWRQHHVQCVTERLAMAERMERALREILEHNCEEYCWACHLKLEAALAGEGGERQPRD